MLESSYCFWLIVNWNKKYLHYLDLKVETISRNVHQQAALHDGSLKVYLQPTSSHKSDQDKFWVLFQFLHKVNKIS